MCHLMMNYFNIVNNEHNFIYKRNEITNTVIIIKKKKQSKLNNTLLFEKLKTLLKEKKKRGRMIINIEIERHTTHDYK